ncbi:DUF2971 domain-containing protein [Phaeobacter piscinae]|uniref:DUF2971 domain-containing protein n=1 Tax=Phaeobacter piscinae TaxID=1580596 RepID=A0AAN1GRM0_9RHOB|nr:DUF2971 domain-containing protein [Phaeobacter piscinae]ATG43927.1 hypothetical protein PhaeoP13_01998 [Phaeobacter piscinae]
MRLYQYTGPEHVVESIKKQHLKISFSDQVNDIFEMMPYDFGDNSELRRRWRKSIQDHAKSTGFLCFSSSWQSPSMWGLYASSHKGVCLGFDVPSNLTKILYVKSYKKFDETTLSNNHRLDNAFKYAQKTKSRHWMNEKEWRMFIQLDCDEIRRKSNEELVFIRFSDARLKLREIIIGEKSERRSSEFRQVLKDTDEVTIKTARASFRDFKIVEQRNSRLQK